MQLQTEITKNNSGILLHVIEVITEIGYLCYFDIRGAILRVTDTNGNHILNITIEKSNIIIWINGMPKNQILELSNPDVFNTIKRIVELAFDRFAISGIISALSRVSTISIPEQSVKNVLNNTRALYNSLKELKLCQ